MKKLLVMLPLLFLISAPAQAKDSCSSVLCLAGMFQGVGVAIGCQKPVSNYFSIVKFSKHGGISLNKTSKARGSFLNKCPSAGGWSKKLNDKYGKQI